MIDCQHRHIRTWLFEDTSTPAGMWSCVDCGLRFEPLADAIDYAAAVAQERERCARLCDELHHQWRWDNASDSASGPLDCAAAIRATELSK